MTATLLACACSSTSTPAAPEPSAAGAPSPAEQRVEDARYLVDEMRRNHPDLYHSIPRRRFDQAAERLLTSAPDLTDEQFVVEVSRLNALPTLRGRDGHGGVFTIHAGVPLHSLPLKAYGFSDGLFVVDALEPHRDLVGAEILAIEGRSIRTVRKVLDPLITRDNPTTVEARFPPTAMTLELLQGTGLVDGDRPRVRFRDRSGRTFTRRLAAVPMATYARFVGGMMGLMRLPRDPHVLYLSKPNAASWTRYLAESRTLFAQYNMVTTPTSLVAQIQKALRTKDVDRVVLDLRGNQGGDNTTYGSLVGALGEPAVRRRDLFVITGRVTFSAAGNLAGELDAETDAVFVGEPPGGSPNQFGDRHEIELPRSGIVAGVSVYCVEVVPGDERLSIEPDIPAWPSSADYFEGRDPAMEAILARAEQAG